MTRKRTALLAGSLVATVVVIVGAMTIPAAFDRALESRFVGSGHVQRLLDQPPHLTEDLALAMATETLARSGFDTNAWRPLPTDRSVAPDGRVDRYLLRNTLNPNHGKFTVADAAGSRRYVRVELEDGAITSWIITPK